MAGESLPGGPRPLDRTALERVLARASELQSLGSDVPEALSDEQVVELGKEVGLTPEAIRQALAEERGRALVARPTGVGGALFGGREFAATRVVPGTPTAVLARITTLMTQHARLVEKRRFPDRLVWDAGQGFFTTMARAVAADQFGQHLARADEVSASVVPVDAGRTFVRLDATLVGVRRTAGGTFTGVAVFSGVGWLALSWIGVPVLITSAIAALPVGMAALIARSTYRSYAERLQVALEQVLDRLEFGPGR
jgi:hypothetical protein